jgi:hypothetical protein
MILGRSDYHWAHEPMLYAKKTGGKTPWYGDRTGKTILRQRRTELNALKKEELVALLIQLQDGSTVWELDRDAVVTYQHPTQKPVTLAGRAITNSSQEGEIVLDQFGGSGSTIVACEQLGRAARTTELDPRYCQVILDRMRALNPDLEITQGRIQEHGIDTGSATDHFQEILQTTKEAYPEDTVEDITGFTPEQVMERAKKIARTPPKITIDEVMTNKGGQDA